MKEKRKFHYGWFVTAGCGIILFYSYGLAVNVFSVFMQPVIDSLRITKAQGSSILSILNIVGIAAMLISGYLYNRYKVNRISFIYGLLIASGFVVFAYAKSLGHCYLAAILIGSGWGGGSMIPVSILISRWFRNSNGIALGIAASGSGLATMIFPPVLARMIENHGLTFSFLFHAASIFVLVLISHLLIKNSPDELGVEPYSKKHMTRRKMAVPSRNAEFKDGQDLKNLIKLSIVSFLVGTSVIPMIAHFSVILISYGYSTIYAGTMVSVFGISMIAGKIMYGYVVDHNLNRPRRADIYIFWLWIVSLSTIFLLPIGDHMPLVFAISTGLGSPIGTVAIPLWTEEVFGKKDYSLFFTRLIVSYNIGSVIGMLIPGALADITGSYGTAFIFYIICNAVAFVLLENLRSNTL